MSKILEGVVVSLKMQKTAVVSVSRVTAHPIYKKLIKRDRRIKADTALIKLTVGDRVKMQETKPISKQKAYKILEVLPK
jgi:small subunit ribosomal protein S17